jgi:soluble P-type ATPase
MIEIDIPGFRNLQLNHLVMDYNGPLATDGLLLPGVSELLVKLAPNLQLHVVTADTFGLATAQLAGLPVKLTILPAAGQAEGKLDYVCRLGADTVVGIGNGRNDRLMLKAVAIGIAILQEECAAAETVANAHILSTDILDALNLLCIPKRLVATLRS